MAEGAGTGSQPPAARHPSKRLHAKENVCPSERDPYIELSDQRSSSVPEIPSRASPYPASSSVDTVMPRSRPPTPYDLGDSRAPSRSSSSILSSSSSLSWGPSSCSSTSSSSSSSGSGGNSRAPLAASLRADELLDASPTALGHRSYTLLTHRDLTASAHGALESYYRAGNGFQDLHARDEKLDDSDAGDTDHEDVADYEHHDHDSLLEEDLVDDDEHSNDENGISYSSLRAPCSESLRPEQHHQHDDDDDDHHSTVSLVPPLPSLIANETLIDDNDDDGDDTEQDGELTDVDQGDEGDDSDDYATTEVDGDFGPCDECMLAEQQQQLLHYTPLDGLVPGDNNNNNNNNGAASGPSNVGEEEESSVLDETMVVHSDDMSDFDHASSPSIDRPPSIRLSPVEYSDIVSSENIIDHLPAELLVYIFSLLASIREIASVRRVCKRVRSC